MDQERVGMKVADVYKLSGEFLLKALYYAIEEGYQKVKIHMENKTFVDQTKWNQFLATKETKHFETFLTSEINSKRLEEYLKRYHVGFAIQDNKDGTSTIAIDAKRLLHQQIQVSQPYRQNQVNQLHQQNQVNQSHRQNRVSQPYRQNQANQSHRQNQANQLHRQNQVNQSHQQNQVNHQNQHSRLLLKLQNNQEHQGRLVKTSRLFQLLLRLKGGHQPHLLKRKIRQV